MADRKRGEPAMEYEIVDTHIDYIQAGDTVLHEGKMKTVCQKDVKLCSFIGKTLFGDSYCSGREPVELVKFILPKLPIHQKA